MASEGRDVSIASLANGFTLGFGLLTVWEAIKQTRRSKNPRRSSYIYMIWGEVLANVGILILGNLVFYQIISADVPALFFILLFWVFEIQLLMQIIINRISIISETQKTIQKLKYGTALVITAINVAVFCIFIPAHLDPPVSQTYVDINRVWDRTSKVLICLVDASLNYYFLRVVKQRLVEQYGLMKYEPLVGFNSRLMVVSVLLDLLLIGLMSLPNQEVFILFHPLIYMAKLNIEMTMASLIVKLARTGRADAYQHHQTSQHGNSSGTPHRHGGMGKRGKNNKNNNNDRMSKRAGGASDVEDCCVDMVDDDLDGTHNGNERDVALKTFTESRIRSSSDERGGQRKAAAAVVTHGGIQRTREFQVTIHHSSAASLDDDAKGSGGSVATNDDDAWLTSHPGHPNGVAR